MTGLLHDALTAAARERPDAIALVCGAERIPYARLERMSAAVARSLAGSGVVAGDRVALFLDNSVEWVAGLYGVLRLGAVAMPFNPTTRADKLGALLARTRAAALLAHAGLSAAWAPAIREVASLRTSLVVPGRAPASAPDAASLHAWPADADAPDAPCPDADVDPDALALISHTSGTSGLPKGVMLSHRNLSHAIESIIGYLGLRGDDVILCALPLSFNYGLTHVLMATRLGATLVLERSFTFPVRTLEVMQRERATVFPGVPTMYAMLTGLDDLARFDLSALRVLTNAAAALPPATIARVRACFPQARLYSMYGQTECTRISYLPPEELDRRPASVGRGMPGQDAWLVDEAGRRLPPGAEGELVVSGPHVMLGYWDDPEATARKLRAAPAPGSRTLLTGDRFRSDADGWLHFVARQDDIIKSRGEKVSPREVEDAIHELAQVQECAVAGVPDPLLGQAVKAWVILREGAALDERAVIRHCQARLEHFMAPRSVVFVDALPRTANGKIRKLDLQ
jgi:long-chain acyl-CoA synthetase